jgi:ABC-type sugar transport system ATPase subunit
LSVVDGESEMETGYVLEMNGITKEFPGVVALAEVSLKVRKGDIHAVVGENGAGKSTLMKVLSGYYPCGSYSGEILVKGKACGFRCVREAEQAGIAIIFQELNLARNLSVAENIFIGRPVSSHGIINWNKMYSEASRWLADVGLNVNPETKVEDLKIGKRQLVEIAKALSKNADILILDEPTSSLTESEVDNLVDILTSLTHKGVTCIYISHKLKEVFRVADSITILRDGKLICAEKKDSITQPKVISLMVGRDIRNFFPTVDHAIGEVVFEIRNMTLTSREKETPVVKNASFHVRRGEILGIAGLMGAGRTELLLGIFGAFQGKIEGEVLVKGRKAVIKDPADAIDLGMSLVPEDRRNAGLVMTFNVAKNLTLASLRNISRLSFISLNKEIRYGMQIKDNIKIKMPSLETDIGNLSGGNQQKVVIGKWLARGEPVVLFLDEPTRGIDVGAKHEIYTIINDLAKRGISIVMVSSELSEILGLCDRVLVMHEGKISGEFPRDEATEEKIMHAATLGA